MQQGPFKLINATVKIVQYVLTLILMVIISQILIASYYSTVWLIIATVISYAFAIVMMVLLAKSFFSWFRSNRNSVVLSYGISSAIFAINLVVVLFFVSELLLDRPSEIRQFLAVSTPFFGSGSLMSSLDSVYVSSTIISFLAMWGATVLLLRHYSSRVGKVKYWIIVTIPLAYFLSQFVTLFLNVFATFLTSSPAFLSITTHQ